MQLNSHVIFNGQCEDAFKCYEACLGGEIVGMWRHAETPGENHVLGESHNQVIHATLDLDGDLLQGCDVPSDHYQKPQGFSVKLDLKDTAEAERIFQALAEDGTVQMPLQETFWALRFGMLVDRFGIPWMINCGQEV
jgi:PhnB protein